MYYLKRYVGTYRVKADYDQDTNDFPRLENGQLDPSFDDLYIDCKNGIQIRHGAGSILSCYIPNKSRGINILKRIYEDKVSDQLPTETSKTQRYYDNLCKQLKESKVVADAEVLDFEAFFAFQAKDIEYFAKLVGAKTSGASISPFSVKNLPKTAYKIPDEDMELYNEAMKNIPTKTVNFKGKERTMVDGLIVKQINSQFDKIIARSQSDKFNVEQDRKVKGLRGKEYIHSLGSDMWERYCEFIKNYKGD